MKRWQVYRNLHTGGWSVRHGGIVEKRFKASEIVVIVDPFATVGASGRARAQKSGQRNVHAFLCSNIEPEAVQFPDLNGLKDRLTANGFVRVSYAPFDKKGWHRKDNDQPFKAADEAVLIDGREVWVRGAR